MKMIRSVLILLTLFLAAGATAEAGKLFARELGTASPIYNLVQQEVRSHVIIRNRLAVTHVDETFRNDHPYELEGFYVFELPDGARADGLWMWVDGERIRFVVKRLEEAKQIYDSLKQEGVGDPAILETMSANRFQLRIFPIRPGEERRIEIEYFHELPVNREGTLRYTYPLNMSGYQSAPLQRIALRVELAMDAPITSSKTNFDDRPTMLSRTDVSDRRQLLDLEHENLLIEEDFALTFALEGWSDSLFVLTHTETGTSDSSFFMLWFPDTIDVSQDVKTDFIFAIDASGSMTGLRQGMVMTAMANIMARLLPSDRCHILLFNGDILHFPSDTGMIFANITARMTASTFLQLKYTPRGITDYETVLKAIGRLALRPEANKRCIFITDGLPNRGATDAGELAAHLRVGTHTVCFYPITIFTERLELLHDLAGMTGGRLCALEQGMDFDDALRRTTFSFENTLVQDALLEYPAGVADIFPATSLLVTNPAAMTGTGRFLSPVRDSCTFSYRPQGFSVRHRATRPLLLREDTTELVQVARLWASKRIDQLLVRLRDVEDSTEIREAVIRLSEKYNLLTPFTAFIAYREVDPGDANAVGEIAAARDLELEQNYPNPFNPATTIRFFIPSRSSGDSRVRICIYDALGRLVRTLADRDYAPGTHSLVWDGRDDAGIALPSGTYFCVLTRGGLQRSITMTLLK